MSGSRDVRQSGALSLGGQEPGLVNSAGPVAAVVSPGRLLGDEPPPQGGSTSRLPRWLEGITLFLRGALMGVADVIPGVSGGTVALIVGVYERLIMGLHTVFAVPRRLVQNGFRSAQEAFLQIPWFFLVLLGLGIGTALLVGAHFIPGYYARWTVQANALFFGLILGSLAVPLHRIQVRRAGLYLLAGAAAVLAFLLTSFPSRVAQDPAPLLVAGGAMIAITAMVLPGVSGSYLLHVFGLWVPTLDAVNERDFAYLGVFALGAILGAVIIVHAISWLLRRYHDRTLAVLVGLMLGALRALWPWTDETEAMVLPEPSFAMLGVPLLLMLAGFLFVHLLDTWGRRQVETHAPAR